MLLQCVRDWKRRIVDRAASRALRILVIDDYVPHHAIGAGTPRAYELLRAFSGTGARVAHFATLPRPDGHAQAKLSFPGLRIVGDRVGNSGVLRPYLVRKGRQFDAIIVSRRHNLIALNEVLPDLHGDAASPIVVFDSEAIFAVREHLQRQVLDRAMTADDMSVDAELSLARTAQIVIAVNDLDAAAYRASRHSDVRVIGHAIVPAFGARSHAKRSRLLFVGPAYDDDTPNTDSLVWFCDRVLPTIRATAGADRMLSHVGIALAPKVRSRIGKTIEWRGTVANLVPEYDAARVFVAPTRFASGIPLKVCEAAAHGIPCVLTPVLARQLGWRHDCEALVAETPDAFAHACLALMNDETLWQRIRIAAFARITRDCDRSRFDAVVGDLCRDIKAMRGGVQAQAQSQADI